MPTPTCSIPLRVKMAKRYAYKKGGPVGPPFFFAVYPSNFDQDALQKISEPGG